MDYGYVIGIYILYNYQTISKCLKSIRSSTLFGKLWDLRFGTRPLDLRTADRSRSCAFPRAWPRKRWQNKVRPPQLGVEIMDVMVYV